MHNTQVVDEMHYILSIAERGDAETAVEHDPDIIELRLDLLGNQISPEDLYILNPRALPVIATIRSNEEGGSFRGTPHEWRSEIEQWIPSADFIDIERAFGRFAPRIRERGCRIIASAHLAGMPERKELLSLEEELRTYGDIPKIVVTPGDRSDLLRLLEFTLGAESPICTGISGKKFRYGRALLPLFGSELVYCHGGRPTAEGQYHINDMHALMEMLR
jgi:3-dehydroquinate dehydratase-1